MRKNLINCLPIIAQSLGEKFGLDIVMGAQGAATNGKTIFLPALPDDDEKALVLTRGYIDHEAAHVRITDFSVWPSGIEKPFTNIFEDIRIEQDTINRYPGSRQNLYDLVEAVIDQGGFAMPEGEPHPFSIVHNFLLSRLRSKVLGQTALSANSDAWEAHIDKVFPFAFKKTLEDIMSRAAQQQSTADAVSLAKEVLKAMEDHQVEEEKKAEDNPNEEPSDENDSDDEYGEDENAEADSSQSSEQGTSSVGTPGDDGESDESGDEPDADEDADDSVSDNSSADIDGEEEEGQDDTGDAQSSTGGETDSDSPEDSSSAGGENDGDESDQSRDYADALNRALSEWDEQQVDDLGDEVKKLLNEYSTESIRTGQTMVALPEIATDDQCGIPVTKGDVARETQALRVKLASKLRAQRVVNSAPKRTGKRIDTRSIHRLKAGDTRVFRNKQPRELPNTGIAVLLDQSTSMVGDNSLIATKACMAVAMATQGQKGIKTIIGGYSSDLHSRIVPYKEAGSAFRPDRFYAKAQGGTPTAEALWWAAHKLISTHGIQRRIILNITDGYPSDFDEAAKAFSKITELGIEVLSLGIECDVAPSITSKSTFIRSISELPRELFSLLEKELIVAAA